VGIILEKDCITTQTIGEVTIMVWLKGGFRWQYILSLGHLCAVCLTADNFSIPIVSLYQSFLIMKNAVLNLAAFLLLASALFACKKEKTFKDELVGHWLSTNVTINGADASNTYTFDLNLEGSREFSLILTRTVPFTEKFIQLYNGDWVENHSKQDVTLNYTDGEQKTWDIMAISETSMTAELIENSTRYQVIFERQ